MAKEDLGSHLDGILYGVEDKSMLSGPWDTQGIGFRAKREHKPVILEGSALFEQDAAPCSAQALRKLVPAVLSDQLKTSCCAAPGRLPALPASLGSMDFTPSCIHSSELAQ